VSLYAVEKFTVTNFLIENNKLYSNLFISKDVMYTLDEVYEQIEHIAHAVSVQCLFIHCIAGLTI